MICFLFMKHCRQKSLGLLSLVFALGCLTLHGEIIPAERRIDWSPGVPGGIPNYPVASIVSPSGGDDTSAIQSALNAIAGTSKAVLLTNGTYSVLGAITIPSGTVLRGAGANTVVNINNSANAAAFSIYQSPGYGFQADLLYTNALPKGASNLVSTVTASGLFVGSCIQIQQSNSAQVVTGLEGNSGQWAQGQWVIITAINNGTNITFHPPLHTRYDTSLAPRIRYPYWVNLNNMLWGAGLEKMKIVNLNASAQSAIDVHLAYACWIKGVELVNCAGRHIWMHDTFRCEIRDSYLHGALPPITSSRGYAIELGDPSSGLPCTKSTDLLIENNIFSLNRGDVVVGNGASGCVVAYNYFLPGTNETSTIQSASLSIHSSYPTMNLFEGNVCYYVNADAFHGSGETATFFRNNVLGVSAGKLSQINCIQLDAFQNSHNIVGNVLAYLGVTNDVAGAGGTSVYLRITPSYASTAEYKVLMLGYDGSGGGTSLNGTNVFNTTLVSGNFDYVQNQTTWDAASTDHTLPDSYYLSAKPAWWGPDPWPPIGPDRIPMVGRIPAQVRFKWNLRIGP